MFNKIILVGNLTRDIEMKYTQGGMAIAKTAIATSRKFKSNTGEQKEEVCFVDITFFGRSAEVANQYLRKASKILVEGRLAFDQWSDQNGQTRSKHSVNVDVMQMLGNKENNGYQDNANHIEQSTRDTYNPQEAQQASQATYGNNPPPSSKEIPSIDIDDEDIPF